MTATVIMLNIVRQMLTGFSARVTETLVAANGLDEDQAKGLRNLIGEGLRLGGNRLKGYYSVLPSGKGNETAVSAAVVADAQQRAKDVLQRNLGDATIGLLPALINAGTVEGGFSKDGKAAKGRKGEPGYVPAVKGTAMLVDIPTEGWELFTDEDLDSIMDSATAGGAKNAQLMKLDF